MNLPPRPRPWILIAGAAVAIVAAFLVFRPDSPLTVPEMATYLPAPEAAVFFADVAALRQAGVLDKLLGSGVAEEPDYKQFVEKTGFNYRTDLERIMGSSSGETRAFVVQGKFDWDHLTSYATTQGGRCENSLCTVPGSQPGKNISFRKLSKSLMALAFSPDPKAAGSVTVQKDRKLMFNPPTEPVWLSLPGAALQQADALPLGTRQFVKTVENAERVALAAGPDGNRFAFLLDVTCRNPEEAAVLRAQLDALTAILQKFIAREDQSPNPTDLSGILSSGTFNRSGRNVTGKWPVERAFLDSLAGGS